MGKTFENLTEEELCDLMCGGPEEDPEEDNDWKNNESSLLIIDENTDPDLYKEILSSIRKYRVKGASWGDIYYKLCMMLHDAMYDIKTDEKYK